MITAPYLYDCDPAAEHGIPVPAQDRRPLSLIAADALKATCGECWAHPGEPCPVAGMHLARYARARRHRLISAADMAVVLDVAAPRPEDVFTPATVIPAVPARSAS